MRYYSNSAHYRNWPPLYLSNLSSPSCLFPLYLWTHVGRISPVGPVYIDETLLLKMHNGKRYNILSTGAETQVTQLFFPLTEKYFDMNKKQAREALDLYKKFLIRMDRVAEFLKVAEVCRQHVNHKKNQVKQSCEHVDIFLSCFFKLADAHLTYS